MGLSACPDRAELEDSWSEISRSASFADRRPRRALRRVRTRLQTLDQVSDPLLSRLRRLGPELQAVAERVPDELIARVRSSAARRGSVVALGRRRLHAAWAGSSCSSGSGAGSFGYVFRARDTELGRMVAIKIPRAGSLASKEDAARFLREARSAAQLKHPGIVALHETGQADDGTFYLVEEFVQGTTLGERAWATGAGCRFARRPS